MSYSEAWRPSLRLPRQNGKTNPLVRRVIELEDENTKLREVLQDAYDDYCIMYTYVDDAYCFEDLHEDPLFGPTVRLLEEALGIEVDA